MRPRVADCIWKKGCLYRTSVLSEVFGKYSTDDDHGADKGRNSTKIKSTCVRYGCNVDVYLATAFRKKVCCVVRPRRSFCLIPDNRVPRIICESGGEAGEVKEVENGDQWHRTNT